MKQVKKTMALWMIFVLLSVSCGQATLAVTNSPSNEETSITTDAEEEIELPYLREDLAVSNDEPLEAKQETDSSVKAESESGVISAEDASTKEEEKIADTTDLQEPSTSNEQGEPLSSEKVAVESEKTPRLWGDVHVIVNGKAHLPSEPLFDQNTAKEGETKPIIVDSKYDWRYSQYGDGEIELSIPESKAGKTALEITFIKAGNVSIVFERTDGGDKETFILNVGKGEITTSKVTGKHLDENGNTLAPTENLEGKVNSSYETSAQTIEGYVFKEMDQKSAPAKGQFKKDVQVVIYIYSAIVPADVGVVSVEHLDTSGYKLTETRYLHGKVGTSYSASVKEFNGFAYKELSSESSPQVGNFTLAPQTVVFIYEKLPQVEISSLIIKHVDEEGNNLLGVETLHAKVGDAYAVTEDEIDGYVFKEMAKESAPKEGHYQESPQMIIFVYTKEPQVSISSVTVEYVDDQGKPLIEKETIHGKVGSPYQTSQRKFPGYIFKEMAKNSAAPIGKYQAGLQEVVYVYIKVPVVAVSSVLVKHLDESGRTLASKEILHGKVGDVYETHDLKIAGYAFKELSVESAAKSGVFKETPQEVVYIYAKLPDTEVNSVSIEHVDEKGRALMDKKIIHGKVGSDYQTSRANFLGYTFKEMAKNSAPASGTFKDTPQEVVYVYAILPNVSIGSVSVSHVDESGRTLYGTEIIHGKIGTDYTTRTRRISGYAFKELSNTSASAQGKFTELPQSVIYIYAKLPDVSIKSVSVSHVDESGRTLYELEVLHGKLGSDYTTSVRPIAGYTFKEMAKTSAPANGKFSETPQSVIYVYAKLPDVTISSVSVSHVDESGRTLYETEIIHGKVGASYYTSPVSISGYVFKEMSKTSVPANGKFKDTAQSVIYVYAKLPDVSIKSVSVSHVDESGRTLYELEVLHGKLGSDYTTSVRRIAGYTFKEMAKNSAPANGKFSETPQEVIYVYAKLPDVTISSVSVSHVDESGRTLYETEIIHGKVGASYYTSPVSIPGYVFKEMSKTSVPANGKFKATAQSVIYVYAKLPDVSIGSLSVSHVDETGQTLYETEILHGKIGSDYMTSVRRISGYTFKEMAKNSAPASGTFKDTPQEVIYVYAKLPDVTISSVSVSHVDEAGQTLYETEILHGKIGSDYTTSVRRISGYTFKEMAKNSAPASGTFKDTPQEVIYVYAKNISVEIGSVTVEYIDRDGNALAAVDTLHGEVGTSYETSPRQIEGYKFKEMADDSSAVKGIYESIPQRVIYVYEKNTADTNPEPVVPTKPNQPHKQTKSTNSLLPATGEQRNIVVLSIGVILLMITLGLSYNGRQRK